MRIFNKYCKLLPIAHSMLKEIIVKRSPQVRGLAVLAGLTLILSACSDGATGDGGNGADGGDGGVAQDGEIIFAVDAPGLHFDPNVTPAAADARVLRQVFDGLVSMDDEGTIVAGLAEEWDVSDDGLTYTFQLRDGVTFHDDTEFNADAVCFNLDRIKDPATASLYAVSLIGPYDSCEAPDASTAEITLSAPYAPFLPVLSSPFLGMVSPTAVETQGAEDFSFNPKGTGPFMLTEYVPMSHMTLERNDDYDWAPANTAHEGPAHLAKVTFQIMADPTVRLGSLRSDALQAVGNVPETEAAGVEADDALEFHAVPQSGSPFQLYFNQSKAPFDDQNVREAFAHAVDVGSIVESLYFGVYQQASGNLAPTTLGHDESLLDFHAYDVERANQLLDEAGWVPGADGVRTKDGERLSLVYVEQTPNREKRQDIAQIVKTHAEAVGFEVELGLHQTAALQAAQQNNQYNIFGLSLVNIDPNVMWSILGSPFRPTPEAGGFNMAHVEHFDDALREAQAELDETRRVELYTALQQQVSEEAVSLPIYVPTYTMATKGIEGLRFDAEGYPVFYDVQLSAGN